MTRAAGVRNPPAGLGRMLLRAPVMLYRTRLGWLLGSRVMLIEHVGRRTGRIRRTVVEVVERDRADDSYVVASGFGGAAQWYRNLLANPTAMIQVGRRRVRVDAVPLTAAEGGQILVDYAARHPGIARRLLRYLGHPGVSDGDDSTYRSVGQHIPFLRLTAAVPVAATPERAVRDLPEPEPDKTTRTVRLADGRALAYAQWGDPHGFPVFYFHGTPGSRMEGAFADRAAARQGMRLLALDRPGFGRSTFQPRRRFQDWPGDVCAVADALGFGTFGVVGHSGGGPHLFACGAFLPPRRLAFIGALGPWGPVVTPDTIAGMHRLDRFYTTVARRAPWVMRVSFAPLGWCAKRLPRLFLALLRAASAPSDRAALADGRLAAHLLLSQVEAFRQGGRGGAHEALIAYRDWGFDIADVRVPTHVWLGEEDIYVPAAMGRHLQERIPGIEVHWLPGQGHFAIDRWDDILAACRTRL